MAVRELKAPVGGRTRKLRFPFDEKEVAAAIKLLKDGKTPGVGPYDGNGDGDKGLREARSAAQSLIRHIEATTDQFGEGGLGTKAWASDEGAFAIVRTRS